MPNFVNIYMTVPQQPSTIPDGERQSPCLYLMPVPLSDGDLHEVIPERNIEIACSIRYFIVENLRTARRWLKRMARDIDIDAATFYVLDEHTRPEDVEAMLNPLAEGHDMAVMSEAGCPAVADPGADAVAVAQRRGYKVVPLVGPSSILMALMASGFNGQSFTFAGYLPIDPVKRKKCLRDMEHRVRHEHHTQIFIETPYRNNRLIEQLCQTLPGDLRLCVASDVTGPGENIITRPLRLWSRTKYDYAKVPTIFLLG